MRIESDADVKTLDKKFEYWETRKIQLRPGLDVCQQLQHRYLADGANILVTLPVFV